MSNSRSSRSPHEDRHDDSRPDRPLERSFGDYQLFVGGADSDRFTGSNRMDIALGRGRSDWLIGGANEDELIGGGGNDRLDSGAGADHLVAGSGNDRLSGGEDADTLRGEDGNDILDEGAGHGDLDGGRGNDILIGGPGADAFVIAPDSGNDVIKDFVAGPGMFDHLAIRDLKPEDLRFTDTNQGVLISWKTSQGSGSVLLEGVAKTDLAQNDFMFADDRYLIRQTDEDATRVTAVSYAKSEGAGNSVTASGDSSGQFQLAVDEYQIRYGTNASETLQGTSGNDLYFGMGGNDRLLGKGGNDHLAGDAGNDVLDGGGGEDDLRGGMGNDEIHGGAMADGLMGGAGNDILDGGLGHDMLEGGAGNDILNGGDGADAFIVAHGSGNDVVVGGFDAGPGAFDHIAFTDVLPNEVTVTDITSRSASPHGDGHTGVLVSWSDGSIFLEGVFKSQMSQDDFMFSAIEGGGFVPDPAISLEGTQPIFIG